MSVSAMANGRRQISRPAQRREGLHFWIFLLLTWAACGAYMAANLRRGWIPHDDGALAQSAERALSGELPHRDFIEIYTGGLTFLNAAAFRVLGANLFTLRIVLYVFFLLWVPVVYWIAARYVSPPIATLVSFLSVAWSVPNYAAAVPSWYNLFFACFGAAAILRYLDTERSSWLFLAGLSGGLSSLVKSVALYYIAAVLLFLAYREQDISRQSAAASGSRRSSYSLLVAAGAVSLPVMLTVLVWQHRWASELIHFVLPCGALSAVVLSRELAGIPAEGAQRARTIAGMVLPFVAGAALPVVIFVSYYAARYAVADLVAGVFLLPRRRVWASVFASPPPYHLGATLLVFGPLSIANRLRERYQWIVRFSLLILGAALLWGSARHPNLHRVAWDSSAELIVPVMLVGAVLLHRASRSQPGEARRQEQEWMLLLSLLSLCAVVQFPFSAPIYSCYVAPLLILAMTAWIAGRARPVQILAAGMCVFSLLFVVFLVTPSFINHMRSSYVPDEQTTLLKLDRAGGLRVSGDEARTYEQVISLVRQHAAGDTIYAAPDCPEVYFLAGKKNPTRDLFDFLNPNPDDPDGVLKIISAHNIRVVVIRRDRTFSPPPSSPLLAALDRDLPHVVMTGKFEVRWRGGLE